MKLTSFILLNKDFLRHETGGNIRHFYAAAFLSIITLLMFGDKLFQSGTMILSKEGTDTYGLFIYWREFAFNQLKQGILPLWNTHIFSGAPFLAGFQSSLFYPLNWVYLFLPLGMAVNVSIALHVFLLGFFMYLWTSSRGLHPMACITTSVIMMFSSPNIMHIYAGHLIDISTMAWTPLLFLIVDKIFAKPDIKLCLAGIFIVTMQILGGHPQYFYFTTITVGIYAAFSLLNTQHRLNAILSMAIIYIFAVILTAIQILPALEAANESVRSGGVSFTFASMFSFPPENLITLVAPLFFGDIETIPYWGRCYFWAMTLFIGITGLTLAIYGIIYGSKSRRKYSSCMVIILFILALGAHTPLFNLLYHWLPGFNNFRGSSKFIFLLTLFLVMLAGIGLDHFTKYKNKNIVAAIIVFSGGIILAGSSLFISLSADGSISGDLWKNILQYISATKESYLSSRFYTDPAFLHLSAMFSTHALMKSAAVCFILSMLFIFAKHYKVAVYLMILLALTETFIFAERFTPAFDMNKILTQNHAVAKFIREHPGDYRILNLVHPNSAMFIGAGDIWGYDAGVPLRYAEFIYFTQGLNPNRPTQYVNFENSHRLFSMLRCRYIFFLDKDKISVFDRKDAMQRVHLISRWQVLKKRDDIFKALASESFDPRQTVILESSPGIRPVPNSRVGECRIAASSVNDLIIRVKIESPALLLLTDSYNKNWKATPLPGSSQNTYRVMPANYTLMAIPLNAGEHHLKLEYSPRSFIIGKWVSMVAWTTYLIVLLLVITDFRYFSRKY